MLQRANERGLGEVFALLPEHEAAIRLMNPYYQGKELEYLVTGFKSYPQLEYLQSCVNGLLGALEPHLRSVVARRLTSRSN